MDFTHEPHILDKCFDKGFNGYDTLMFFLKHDIMQLMVDYDKGIVVRPNPKGMEAAHLEIDHTRHYEGYN